ncbi:MAG: polyprenyl diphosphate synthase [Acholeplasmataceae bacterium]|nr:polyprenyl diphosphate synthase [Acholeplasmataceae bacterium]MDD4194486.1 polyprenyl diphosphate synthase [Acholeplasmataceae bacterium]
MDLTNIPKHVGIIMDGNGRWAKKRGQPRSFGHYMGGRNLFTVAREAKNIGIETLTVYAFSTENWKRPKEEIDYLMQTPVDFYHKNKDKLYQIDYKISFIGRKDRIPKNLLEVILEIEKNTKDHLGFELVIALDYGGYDEIISSVNQSKLPIDQIQIEKHLMINKPMDLLIRTSGEMRLSNFLLWQASYAELYFTKIHWPSFNGKALKKAIKNYQKRNRRYGGLK